MRATVLPVPGGPTRKARGGDVFKSLSCSGSNTSCAIRLPVSETAWPSVLNSSRDLVIHGISIVVAGPQNLKTFHYYTLDYDTEISKL